MSTVQDWCGTCSAYTEQVIIQLHKPDRAGQACRACAHVTVDVASIPLR